MLFNLRHIARVLGTLIVASANAAEPAALGSGIGTNSVTMRSWPMSGSWSTALGSNPATGRYCATYAADGQTVFGLRTESDPYKALSLVIAGPDDPGVLSAGSIKVWMDGFLLGEFPVTRRFQDPHSVNVHAVVAPSQISGLLDLFGNGGRIAYAAGGKTWSAPLAGSGDALKALSNCAHELATLSAVGATADIEQVEGQNWVARCKQSAVWGGIPDLAASCRGIWDKRTTLRGFAELDANLKTVDTMMGRLDSPYDFNSALQAFGETGVLSQPTSSVTSPQPSGNPLGNDTAELSTEQRGAIGDHVREW